MCSLETTLHKIKSTVEYISDVARNFQWGGG